MSSAESRLKILLTNDDGIDAIGLQKAVELVAPFNAEVAIFAPKRNQSGTGHSVTLWKELEICRVAPRFGVNESWAIDGTPVDAVKFALDNRTFIPDLVLSGINNGANIGDGIFYSGTTNAALEAFFHDVPALALSQEPFVAPRYDTAIAWTRKIIAALMPMIVAKDAFCFNVNFPGVSPDEVKGVRVVKQSRSSFNEKFYPSPSGKENFYALDGKMECSDADEFNDFNAMNAGYVALQPLKILLDDSAMAARMRSLFPA